MIFNRKTLNKFLNLNKVSNEKIIEILINFGFETKIIKDYQKLNSGLVVVKILKKNKDIKFDKLNICRITDGNKEYSVICGADNFKENDLVIFAKVGAVLNKNFKIGKRKFNIHISEGMLCSYEDLGLPILDEEDGIIVLNKNCVLGDEKPLKYIDFDDVVFETEPIPTYPISKSVFGLLKFLSGKLNFKNLENFNIKYDEKKIITNFKNKENSSIQCFYFKNKIKNKQIKWLDVFSRITNSKSKLNIDKLINFINIIFGVSIKKYYLKNKPKNIKLEKNKISINSVSEKDAQLILIIFENLNNNKFFPTAQILNFSIRYFIKILNEEFEVLKIIGDLENCNFRKPDNFKINILKINKLLGIKLSLKEIKRILEPFEFKVNIKNTIANIICPSWNEYKHKNYVIEEIMRFYGCKNIELKEFSKIPNLNFNNKVPKFKKNLEKFLLNIGINQVKNYSMISKDALYSNTTLEIIQDRESRFLCSSLLSGLNKLNFNKNIFTIDKVFMKKENQIEEKIKLGILFNEELYFDVISNSKLKINKLYLISLFENILDLFGISKSNLWQEYSENKKIFLDQKIKSTLFSKKGYEKIYWGNYFLGVIGEINIRKGSIFKHSYYLEIDFDLLMNLKNVNDKIKFIPSLKNDLIYRDYSIFYNEIFEPKIQVELNTKEIIELNNYNYWINLIMNIDSGIKKVELIDIYKNKTLTFRVWIVKENQKNIIENFEKELNLIKNIKIT